MRAMAVTGNTGGDILRMEAGHRYRRQWTARMAFWLEYERWWPQMVLRLGAQMLVTAADVDVDDVAAGNVCAGDRS